jgi:hypothetical protein
MPRDKNTGMEKSMPVSGDWMIVYGFGVGDGVRVLIEPRADVGEAVNSAPGVDSVAEGASVG